VKKPEYNVKLLRVAEDDLSEIVMYIASERPSSAGEIAGKIEKDVALLSHHPLLGRIPQEEELAQSGYRYLVVENYLIFYKIEERTVYVHRILQGARDYLSLF
jgi:toxin ParE1/3/4